MDRALTGQLPPPDGLDAIVHTYGEIRPREGRIVAPTDWERANLVRISDLPGWPHRLYVNKVIVAPLRLALARCIERIDGYVIHSLNCFAPRPKHANRDQWSLHSWGVAIDINPETNPFGAPARADLPKPWIEVFQSVGWTWGGTLAAPDPGHFQWASGY